jgi:type III secretory pathway component EscU
MLNVTMINEISEFLTMDVLCLIPYILELWNCHHRFYIPFPAKPNFGIYHAIFVNTSVFSSLSLAYVILEYISCSLWTLIQAKKKINRSLKRSAQDIKKVSEEHGAEIKGVYYITRSELFPSLYENADFSVDTVKASIREGELKTSQKLRDIEMG